MEYDLSPGAVNSTDLTNHLCITRRILTHLLEGHHGFNINETTCVSRVECYLCSDSVNSTDTAIHLYITLISI